ncbi:MAG: NO-inducible flavohemoprotein [Myxococcales bacterium]|nr:NO-inducible flavohemoprotein [Myxococcales bacterium]
MRASTIGIVKATAPILAHSAVAITTRFYETLLGEHPELRPMFNRSHIERGLQAHALADAVVAYAQCIDHPEVLAPALRRIAHKHASLDVQPRQYEIVGQCLLRAISDVLGDAAAVEIIDAWGEAYEHLAHVLIEMEQDIYRRNEREPGGWRGPRRFQVTRIEPESASIRSFYLVPADGGPLMPFTAGQYLTVLLEIDGQSVRRNYSISCAPGLGHYRITLKRDPEGLVSRYFHDHVRVGHVLDVLPPCGDFVLHESERPLVLVSAGVGITPTISMLDVAVASGRPIVFLHATHRGREHAFRRHVQALSRIHPQLRHAFVYEQLDPGDAPQHVGMLDRAILSRYIAGPDVEVYVVGPQPFMETVFHHVKALGVPEDRIHYEFFGPQQPLSAPADDEPQRVLSRRLRRPTEEYASLA